MRGYLTAYRPKAAPRPAGFQSPWSRPLPYSRAVERLKADIEPFDFRSMLSTPISPVRVPLWLARAAAKRLPGWLASYTYEPSPASATFNSSGWSLVQDCGKTPDNVVYRGPAFNPGCLVLQAAADAVPFGMPPASPLMRTAILMRYQDVGACSGLDQATCGPLLSRFEVAQVYNRDVFALPNIPSPRYVQLPISLPRPGFAWEFETLPLHSYPIPKPVPYTQWKAHARNRNRYQAAFAPHLRPPILRAPSRLPLPLTPLSPSPSSTAVAVAPGGGGVRVPSYHTAAPPRRGNKERKLIFSPPPGSPLGALFHLSTESLDLVNALYYAIPESKRPDRASFPTKLRYVYTHFEDIDLDKALRNVLYMQLQDRLIGKVGQIAGKANRRIWNQYGIRLNLQLGSVF